MCDVIGVSRVKVNEDSQCLQGLNQERDIMLDT